MNCESAEGTRMCHFLSVIVPVLNERDTLQTLTRELNAAAQGVVNDFEIIFVDDGSTDDSWSVIQVLAAAPHITGIRFRRNFGKAAALTAGMRSAGGDLILMIDADLQDDPAEIPRLVAGIRAGADVVNGWKQRRLDPWHKVYPSRVFNWLISHMTGLRLHDHNCGLKLFRSAVAREIRIYGEMHRFIAVLAHARGFRVTEIPVHHRPRQHGYSKYGIRRFLRGFLDLLTVTFLTSFGYRPQHAIGACGLCFLLIGLLGLGYLSALWCLMHVFGLAAPAPIGSRPLLAYSIAATLLGGQALSLGLLAEMILAFSGRPADGYSVRERTGHPGSGSQSDAGLTS